MKTANPMKKLQVKKKKESILNLRNDASAMVKGGKGGKVEESTDTLSPVSGRGSCEAACQTTAQQPEPSDLVPQESY